MGGETSDFQIINQEQRLAANKQWSVVSIRCTAVTGTAGVPPASSHCDRGRAGSPAGQPGCGARPRPHLIKRRAQRVNSTRQRREIE